MIKLILDLFFILYFIIFYRFTSEEVTKKVESYRSMLMGTDTKPAISRDEFGRVK